VIIASLIITISEISEVSEISGEDHPVTVPPDGSRDDTGW